MATRASKRLKVTHIENEKGTKQEEKDTERSTQSNSEPVEEIDYEQIRLENIRRNEQFLATLGLENDRSALAPVSRPSATKRGATGISRHVEPTRRSGRVTIERIKVEIEELKKNNVSSETIEAKEQELADMIAKKADGTFDASAVAPSYEDQRSARLHADPISSLKPINLLEEESESYVRANLIPHLERLAAKDSHAKKKKAIASSAIKEASSSLADYSTRLSKLSVHENDVAKLTEARITSVCCHPSTDKLIVVAGDKAGYLGLWNVDDLDGSNAGVYRYRPHTESIIKIHASDDKTSLIRSVSYDGTIRSLDIKKNAFLQSFEAPESLNDMIFTDASFYSNESDTAIVSRSDGYIALVDFRASNNSYGWKASICDSKINSVQLFPTNENYIITAQSSKDGKIFIHDARKLSSSKGSTKALRTLDGHDKSINAAYCSPDGEYLVSISQDNTIKTWITPLHDIEQPDHTTPQYSKTNVPHVSIRHDNHTGRWLSTFRPAFDEKQPNVFLTGSMDRPRRVEVFGISKNAKNASAVSLLKGLQAEYLASVCSRNCFHPSMDIIIGGNSSGRVHVFR